MLFLYMVGCNSSYSVYVLYKWIWCLDFFSKWLLNLTVKFSEQKLEFSTFYNKNCVITFNRSVNDLNLCTSHKIAEHGVYSEGCRLARKSESRARHERLLLAGAVGVRYAIGTIARGSTEFYVTTSSLPWVLRAFILSALSLQ